MGEPEVKMEEHCGLLREDNMPVALKAVSVEVTVRGWLAEFSFTLEYESREPRPADVFFLFPTEGNCVVTHFLAKIGKTEMEFALEEQFKATGLYRYNAHNGLHLCKNQEGPDLFRLSLGSLAPGGIASIRLSCITELSVQRGAVQLSLPTIISSRCPPPDSDSVPAEPSASGGGVPSSLSLSAHIIFPSGIDTVRANCPLSPLEYLTPDHTQARVSLCPGQQFNQKVELLIYYRNPHQPTVTVEAGLSLDESQKDVPEEKKTPYPYQMVKCALRSCAKLFRGPVENLHKQRGLLQNTQKYSLMKDPVVMLGLFPEFPPEVLSSQSSCGEFLFLLDCSGSMGLPMGSQKRGRRRLECAKDVLQLLLRSLPVGCYFNVCMFGMEHKSVFPESVRYCQDTMDIAITMIQEMEANMKDTMILLPLWKIHNKPCLPAHPRQVFLLTDGGITWDSMRGTAFVKRNALSHRCFTFGIGEGSASAMVTDLAKEASGLSQIITETDRLLPKVVQSLRLALQPAVQEISVRWDVPPGLEVTPLTPQPFAVFPGHRTLLYAQLRGQCDSAAVGSAHIQYTLGGQSFTKEVSFSLKPQKDSGDQRKVQELVGLSFDSGVACVITDYITVQRDTKKPVEGLSPIKTFQSYARWTCEGVACSFEEKVEDWLPDEAARAEESSLLKLVTLQKADGSWTVDGALVSVLGKTDKEVIRGMPEKVLLKRWRTQSQAAWATVLVLLWLHAFQLDSRDEWELMATKAASWIRARPGLSMTQYLEAGNSLLGCQVKPQTLGL
ncbi:von Willebrand factor A domain-containing protein 5A isoform X2 [Amia ocellicauda]|uniref:von Willebrand factor A domain-containing protein 5A isoform X2 n=1 Tax=Amia ocellicauda TaxID=2972642 RepID=UPI003464856F